MPAKPMHRSYPAIAPFPGARLSAASTRFRGRLLRSANVSQMRYHRPERSPDATKLRARPWAAVWRLTGAKRCRRREARRLVGDRDEVDVMRGADEMVTADQIALYDRMARELYVAVISDILDGLGYRNQVMQAAIRPVDPATRKVLVGRAATIQCTPQYEVPLEPYTGIIAAIDSL